MTGSNPVEGCAEDFDCGEMLELSMLKFCCMRL